MRLKHETEKMENLKVISFRDTTKNQGEIIPEIKKILELCTLKSSIHELYFHIKEIEEICEQEIKR